MPATQPHARPHAAGMYIWAQLPPPGLVLQPESASSRGGLDSDTAPATATSGTAGPLPAPDDLDFCTRLVMSTGVALSPGSGFGPGGHGYVRFALVQPEEVLRDCAGKIASLLCGQ